MNGIKFTDKEQIRISNDLRKMGILINLSTRSVLIRNDLDTKKKRENDIYGDIHKLTESVRGFIILF